MDVLKKYFGESKGDKNLTGYPSIDKPWLKYYKKGAEQKATNIPFGKTVWDVIEEKLHEYETVPAIEYFGRTISRQEFIEDVYSWARAFKVLGAKSDEIIPYYGPFTPDVCAMTFALNIIGACPYFLKLAISPEALAEETKDARFAIVFDEMWKNVSNEFSKKRFEKILIATIADAMPSPKKQIVSLFGKIKASKGITKFSHDKRFLWVKQAKEYGSQCHSEVRVPFVSDRSAFITSSSGTTVDGIVKGTVATNESTISQFLMANESDVQFFKGDRCLNHFPPTASTSLNVLFFLALYKGLTVIIDPRVSEKDFYNQITKLKPNIALTTGSAWESFFNIVQQEMLCGKKFDFKCANGWTIGGEGTDVGKFQKWNTIMKNADATNLLFSGYGSSELFSATCVEKVNARYDYSKQIMSVGIPYAGITMGVFDENGIELQYGKRGELRIKSKSAMKEYYNKPDLTNQTKVDGWILTGDLAEIDENGFVYIWGRVNDAIISSNGKRIYLFDIANKIKEKAFINDAIVLTKLTSDSIQKLVVHIVWDESVSESNKVDYIEELNVILHEFLPHDIVICGYAEHQGILPYSPTTLKKDKNRLSRQEDGFVQFVDGELRAVKLN